MFQSKLSHSTQNVAAANRPLQVDPVEMVAALPSKEQVHLLAEQFRFAANVRVFLAFVGVNGLRFAGCLLTKSSIHYPIAFCPISGDLAIGSSMWRSDVLRQLQLARTLAEHPDLEPHSAVSFASLSSGLRDVPAWLFALTCIPISESWTGGLEYPIPFCPTRFGAMARQPQARAWLERHSISDNHETPPALTFTARERTVLRELCLASKSEKQIASSLRLSIHTVHLYIKQIYRKLGVTSRSELMGLFIDRAAVHALVSTGE